MIFKISRAIQMFALPSIACCLASCSIGPGSAHGAALVASTVTSSDIELLSYITASLPEEDRRNRTLVRLPDGFHSNSASLLAGAISYEPSLLDPEVLNDGKGHLVDAPPQADARENAIASNTGIARAVYSPANKAFSFFSATVSIPCGVSLLEDPQTGYTYSGVTDSGYQSDVGIQINTDHSGELGPIGTIQPYISVSNGGGLLKDPIGTTTNYSCDHAFPIRVYVALVDYGPNYMSMKLPARVINSIILSVSEDAPGNDAVTMLEPLALKSGLMSGCQCQVKYVTALATKGVNVFGSYLGVSGDPPDRKPKIEWSALSRASAVAGGYSYSSGPGAIPQTTPIPVLPQAWSEESYKDTIPSGVPASIEQCAILDQGSSFSDRTFGMDERCAQLRIH